MPIYDNEGKIIIRPPNLPPTPQPPQSAEEPEELEQKKKSGWNWVGSPDRPEAKKGDGISDLFRVSDKDIDGGSSDLTTVDLDRDIIDANPETDDLSDLVDVFEEDMMGMPGTGQRPSHRYLQAKRRAMRERRQEPPPTSMGGLR